MRFLREGEARVPNGSGKQCSKLTMRLIDLAFCILLGVFFSDSGEAQSQRPNTSGSKVEEKTELHLREDKVMLPS